MAIDKLQKVVVELPVSERTTYMRGHEFKACLEEAYFDAPIDTFARVFGVNRSTVFRWCSGRSAIPKWAAICAKMVCQNGIENLRGHFSITADHTKAIIN